MSRRSWLITAVAVLVALTVVPALALAARAPSVTRGLDYLHAQQVATTGGYSNPATTAWAILGLVASGERSGSSAWTHGGKNPIKSLQSSNLEASAAADLNPPAYYAQLVLGYMAGGREDYVYAAGTPAIDLLARLYAYQDVTAGSATQGSFSPSSSNRTYKAVRTTSWAILALHTLGIDNDSFTSAVDWLKAQQNGDGGFGVSPGSHSDVPDTALAVQALRAGRFAANSSQVQAGLSYLDSVQRSDGGFADQETSSVKLDADATSFAAQAIHAAGEDPATGRWRTSTGNTPLSALRSLQLKNGATALHRGVLIAPVSVTGRALVALSGQDLVSYPADKPAAVKAFVYRPRFESVEPKNGVTFKATRIVLIRARYNDGAGGTGIDVKHVRLYVDTHNRTKAANVGRYGLHLELKNVPNGKHTYKIVVVDYAGNEREIDRSFTVDVPVMPTFSPTPTITPFPPPTYHPTPTYRPTVTPSITPSVTPSVTPSTTLYPTPTSSASAYPSPTPSSSGSPITGAVVGGPTSGSGGGTSQDGGSVAGLLGGTLLAMVPLGAALSYYLLHRRADLMAGSAAGEQLPGGGSSWERFKRAFARSKDIVKPVRS